SGLRPPLVNGNVTVAASSRTNVGPSDERCLGCHLGHSQNRMNIHASNCCNSYKSDTEKNSINHDNAVGCLIGPRDLRQIEIDPYLRICPQNLQDLCRLDESANGYTFDPLLALWLTTINAACALFSPCWKAVHRAGQETGCDPAWR